MLNFKKLTINYWAMKLRNFLFAIFSVVTLAAFGQTEKNQEVEASATVTELIIETENLEELNNFDWKIVKEMFQENDENQEISLVFAYVNKSDSNKSKVRVDNFEMKFTGKSADLDRLANGLRNSIEKLVEL